MTEQAYAFLGLTALVGGLVAMLAFAALRFAAAARDTKRHLREHGAETALLSAALQEAVARMKAQERAITARAEASERLNSEIVASLTAGLVVVGIQGDVRIVNPSARRLLGLSEPVPEQTFRDYLGEQSPLAQVIDECLATSRAVVRRALQLSEGRPAPLHLGVTVSPLVGEQGAPGGAICLFTDLTAVRDLEEQLRLKDTLARLGELTAGLAHEFRNGLATIHGYARLIDSQALEPKQRQCVEGIRQETDALGRIVTNFLNFARPAQLAVAPVDLRALVDSVAGEVRSEVDARGGSITVDGEFPPIDGDEVLLRQAISNLARNALEACVQAGVAPRVQIEGRVDAGHRSVRLAVSDNGPGIDPSVRERIFRPFFTTKRDGTGLGLALVQKIVVTHNGRVSAHAAPGGGALLEVVLPLGAASLP